MLLAIGVAAALLLMQPLGAPRAHAQVYDMGDDYDPDLAWGSSNTSDPNAQPQSNPQDMSPQEMYGGSDGGASR